MTYLNDPLWLGALALAMAATGLVSGTLAGLLGAGVRRWIADRIDARVIRYMATFALVILGILAVLETLGILVD